MILAECDLHALAKTELETGTVSNDVGVVVFLDGLGIFAAVELLASLLAEPTSGCDDLARNYKSNVR